MDTKNGVIETYYENGQIKSRTNYKDGKRDGLCESWGAGGKPCSRAIYKDGVKQ